MDTAKRSGGSRRTGRPAGESGNREAILAAARREFFARGYGGATIRGIAADAGVDPALVHHYFGSKDRLLLASLEQGDLQELAESAAASLLQGGPEHVGERVVRRMVEVYDVSPDLLGWMGRSFLTGLVRLAATNDLAARQLRKLLTRGGLARLVRGLGVPEPERRLALVLSAVMGLAMARFVLQMEPVASADADTLAAWYGPVVQRLLFDPLPDGGRAADHGRAVPPATSAAARP